MQAAAASGCQPLAVPSLKDLQHATHPVTDSIQVALLGRQGIVWSEGRKEWLGVAALLSCCKHAEYRESICNVNVTMECC